MKFYAKQLLLRFRASFLQYWILAVLVNRVKGREIQIINEQNAHEKGKNMSMHDMHIDFSMFFDHIIEKIDSLGPL